MGFHAHQIKQDDVLLELVQKVKSSAANSQAHEIINNELSKISTVSTRILLICVILFCLKSLFLLLCFLFLNLKNSLKNPQKHRFLKNLLKSLKNSLV